MVFSGHPTAPDLIIPKLLGQVASIHSSLLSPTPAYMEQSQQETQVAWEPPRPGWIKLNSDGSQNHNSGLYACGGLLRDHEGRFITSYFSNLGAATSVAAKLWGVVLGLRIARSLNIRAIQVKSD